MKNSKQPIAPSMWTRHGEGEDDYLPLKDGQKTGYEVKFGGLTKREYFTAAALQGYCASASISVHDCRFLAEWSVITADTVLAELAKQEGE